jgi:hypothetical protein
MDVSRWNKKKIILKMQNHGYVSRKTAHIATKKNGV